ncbi:alpha/beta fold hydrolase [Shimazuella sp. AN120528]|uniref:alpha/beta hydrolase n=1 Tax=Shimazuella soli TaxID=1892854 RepID=UPI001F10098D|nr:alpha/beta fold hydrolase [Shimazuella soli]MCH5586038.1 alpha/beta fold hydrolase [Shimazuella soli]
MQLIKRSPDPFFYSAGKTGILLIHGFTGTPSELRPMGDYLHKQGFTVFAPLLPGHGTSPEDLQMTRWQDWVQSVENAFEELKQSGVERLYLVGLSMGGILALIQTIQQQSLISGVVSMCAPIKVKDFRANFVRLIHWFKPFSLRGEKHPDIEQHLIPYDRTPLKSVGELNRLIRFVRRNLNQIKVPALIIQSRHDETVNPSSATIIYNSISSQDKTLTWYENSSHIITVDRERKKLFQEVEQFILRTSSERE